MSKFNKGDRVRLISTEKGKFYPDEEESCNWINEEPSLPKIGDEFIVDFVHPVDYGIGLVELRYVHPEEKFELA